MPEAKGFNVRGVRPRCALLCAEDELTNELSCISHAARAVVGALFSATRVIERA